MQMKSNCVNIHGYCSNFGYLKNFGLTNVEDFWAKCVKFVAFYILQSLTSIDVDAHHDWVNSPSSNSTNSTNLCASSILTRIEMSNPQPLKLLLWTLRFQQKQCCPHFSSSSVPPTTSSTMFVLIFFFFLRKDISNFY